MIVQCDQCNTRFKLDDAKIKEEGVKVRCSKCKNIFIVKKETPQEENEFESILGQLGSGTSDEDAAQEKETTQPTFGSTTARVSDVSEPAPDVEKLAESPSAKGLEAWPEENFSTSSAGVDAEHEISTNSQGFDFQRFDLEEESSAPQAVAPSRVGMVEEKDDVFDFGEVPAVPGDEFAVNVEGSKAANRPFTTDFPTVPEGEDSKGDTPIDEGLSFSFEKEVQGSVSVEPVEKPSFPLPDEFGPLVSENVALRENETAEGSVESFDFSSIDFGTAAAGGKNSTTSKREIFAEGNSAHASRGTDEFFTFSPATDEPGGQEDELPPLSIASRRKGVSSALIIVITLAVVIVFALAGAGLYFLKDGPAGFEKAGLGFATKWLGLETKENGGISIRNTKGSFVVNKEEGELFVIRGEAVNNFRKPRASVQVKAVLYGPKGEVIAQKNAYCGNMLSDEQVATLPLAKIEEAMNNQFGDSLANLGVQPGKEIPFVVVMSAISKDVSEFGVEVIGSTAASR